MRRCAQCGRPVSPGCDARCPHESIAGLFDGPVDEFTFEPRMVTQRLLREFEAFHAGNPDVYDELRTLALRLKDRGWNHYGISALYEVVRFHRALETTDDTFKLNNNHRAFYARLLMKQVPRLAEFFEIRVQKAG